MSATDLGRFYDRTSHRFWDPRKGPVGRDLIVYPLLDNTAGSLLEYGCGAGSLLLHLAREERFTRAVGVDISEQVLSTLQSALQSENSRLRQKISLVRPENDLLPSVADGSVDVIVSVATIEHVLDPYKVLDELHRIARPGGTLVCSVPNYAYLKHRLALLSGRLPRTGTDDPVENWRQCGWDGMHLHTFTKDAFSTLLMDCGWEPLKWSGWGEKYPWLFKLRQRFPALLSGEIIAQCRRK